MSVYVCLKQVPNVEGVPAIDPESGFLRADAWYLNPLDAYAMRGALETAAALGTDCVAVSFGGPEAGDGLRQALGLGADRAVLASSGTPLAGPGLTAWALAGAIRADSRDNGQRPALVFCGRQSSDVANMQVPYRLAACLGFPVVSEVSSWAVKGGYCDVFRQAGSLREYLTVDLPCVLALNRGQGEMPRPTLPGLIKAKKKSVRVLGPEDIALAQPPEWTAPPADPALLRTRNVSDEHHCRFAQGETVEDRVRDLVRMLRENGSLP
ncbi:putative Electron transfer flavoprotein, beta subunit [uncultured delta proteobacterium]|uniref:Putative Electron transfer flavoprotein, beta subunit n=1 Tax=uncultured delta proteobacterium TaxID=34034 RepID=A0A212K552_9DELT|nr:putative Electron transfer flavoprotein, beta subunit [uncultured delta proteobacterium]